MTSTDASMTRRVEKFSHVTGLTGIRPIDFTPLECEACGCLFLANDDGDDYYPDRFSCVGLDGGHDRAYCVCHEIRHTYSREAEGKPWAPNENF